MIKPFADDEGSMTIADLTVENGKDAVIINGSLEVTRDQMGLKHAQALQTVAANMVEQLQAIKDLPEKAASASDSSSDTVANPFA